MKVHEVPLTLAEHDTDIKIKACTQKSLMSFVTRFCAYNLLRHQVSVNRMVLWFVILLNCIYIYSIANRSLYCHVVCCVPVSCSKANRVGNQFRVWRYSETYAKIRN